MADNYDKDSITAAYDLATMYKEGKTVEKNLAEALRLYEQAAESGHKDAEYYAGIMNYYGSGTERNYSRALKWFQQLAKSGDVDAQCALGVMFGCGQGTEPNLIKGLRWLVRASGKNEFHNSVNILEDYIEKTGDEPYSVDTYKDMEIVKIPKKYDNMSIDALKALADKNDINALCVLGTRYMTLKDIAATDYWFILYLGTPIDRDLGIDGDNELYKSELSEIQKKENRDIARKYLEQAKKAGHQTAVELLEILDDADRDGNAYYTIGREYLLGENGKEKSYEQAAKYFRRAAKRGHPKGQTAIGKMYQYGDGVRQHYGKALKWLEMAAKQNEPEAMYELGVLYQFGEIPELRGDTVSGHVRKDTKKALMWYERAVSCGNKDAQKQLDGMLNKG